MYPDRSIAAAALALLAAIPASPVLADETDSEAEAIVVTATRQATRASELLSDVSVIERADIEKAGSLETLGELLSREGGVEFSSLGAPGSASSIYIRGANAGHTLLLIDGVRVGSATMGAPTFSALPLAQIERIEILKGSASSLYGSDAIGGVIHVITRKGGGPAQLSADASIGDLDARVVNEGANLAVIEAKSPGELLFREKVDGLWLASPIQIYLDLLRGEGRSKEMAEHFRKERIGF